MIIVQPNDYVQRVSDSVMSISNLVDDMPNAGSVIGSANQLLPVSLQLPPPNFVHASGLRWLNPALFPNDKRPTGRDDPMGFGPALLNAIKMASGVRCFDNPVCMDPAHETGHKRVNKFRQKAWCRLCLKYLIEQIPSEATHMQAVRFIVAMTRNAYCPFCLLEQGDRSKMHLVVAKKHCKAHEIINRFTKCEAHGRKWQECKECAFDPRAGTDYCACGVRLHNACACPPSIKGVSHGIRLHTNPFVVPIEAEKERDARWVEDNIERATRMRDDADALRPTLPPKVRRSGPSVRAGPYLKPCQ
jgi:hypothetical protein